MNESSQLAAKPEESNFGKSDSFEHMMAMQEQIFNPPAAGGDSGAKVTDFSSFGGGNTTAVNDLSGHSDISVPTATPEPAADDKPEEVVDSRSEEEMHSLFSDPSAGTVQEVSAEEKQKLEQERQANEQARKAEELKADADYKAAETGESVTPINIDQTTIKAGDESKTEEAPKTAIISQPVDLPKIEEKPAEEKPAEEPKEETHEEPAEEKAEEAPAEEEPKEETHEEPAEEKTEEAPVEEEPKEEEEKAEEEPKEEAPAEEKTEEEPKEEAPAEEKTEEEEKAEETPAEEEPKEETHEEPAEEKAEEAPAETTETSKEDTPAVADNDLPGKIRERLTTLRTERNITIVDIDKLEDALLEGGDTEQIKDQLKAKHEELHHKEHAIAGLIELLHTL